MESGHLNHFQRTLVKAYYYLVIIDGKVDPKELTFGSEMIHKEGIYRDMFEELLDSFSLMPGEQIKSSLIDEIRMLTQPEQIKIVAYMSSLADVDGVTDVSEKDIIHDLCFELQIDFKEIINARQDLKTT